jgi:hypothetical protein
MLTLLRAPPAGLRAEAMRVHLQVDTHSGDTLQGMVRQHVLETQGRGQAVRSLAVGAQGTDTRERRQPTRQARAVPPGPAPALLAAPARVQVPLELCSRQGYWTLRDTDEIRVLARLEAVLTRVPGTATSHG